MRKKGKNVENLMDNFEEVSDGILSAIGTDTEITAYTAGILATKELYLKCLEAPSQLDLSPEDKEKILESWDKKVTEYNNYIECAGERAARKLTTVVQVFPYLLFLCVYLGDEETWKQFSSYKGKLPELSKHVLQLISRK